MCLATGCVPPIPLCAFVRHPAMPPRSTVMQVGDHKASSKTELKTLEPRWNETMAFSAADCEEAEAGKQGSVRAPSTLLILPGAPPGACCCWRQEQAG